MLLAKSNLRQQHYKAVGKEGSRQQRGSPVGEGLLPLPTANGEAVGEADDVGTVWLRRGFANNFSFPTAFSNFANSPWILGCWRRFLSRQQSFPVGKEFLRQQLWSWRLGKTWAVGEATVSCCEHCWSGCIVGRRQLLEVVEIGTCFLN
jgi:hypothetical protein